MAEELFDKTTNTVLDALRRKRVSVVPIGLLGLVKLESPIIAPWLDRHVHTEPQPYQPFLARLASVDSQTVREASCTAVTQDTGGREVVHTQ
jgi:hypothetical protein